MGTLSGILFWLLVWLLVSVPVSLVLARLLKAASAPLPCEDAAHPPEIRRSASRPAGYGAGRRRPWERMAPLGASPAVGR
jgi:hypothetical protein